MAINLNPAQEGSVSSAVGGNIGQAQLTTSAAAVVTVPANTVIKIENATVTNITGTPATLTLHVRKAGAAVTNTNAVEFARSIAANSTVKLESLIGTYLGPTDVVSALSGTATALNINLSGITYS